MKKLNLNYSSILFLLLVFLLPTQLGKHFFLPFSYLSGVRVDYLAPTIYLLDIIVLLLAVLNWRKVLDFFKNKNLIILLILFLINILFAQSIPIAFFRFLKILEFIVLFQLIQVIKNPGGTGGRDPDSAQWMKYDKAGITIKSQTHSGTNHTNNLTDPEHWREGNPRQNLDSPKLILIILTLGAFIQTILTTLQFITKQSIQGIFYFLGERYLTLSMPDIAKGSLNGIEILRPYGSFSHPNSMAGFYLLLYFFVLTFKPFNQKNILKNLFLFLAAVLIFISFSKTAIITFLILNIFYFTRKIFNKKVCRICAISTLFTFLIISFIFLSFRSDPQSLNKRLDLVNNSLTIISQNPLLGVGLNNYLIAQERFPSRYPYFFQQPVHNIFLLFISEAGIIISGFIFWPLWKFIKKNIHKEVYLFLLLIILFTGSFDHYWLSLEQNFLLLAVVLGITS